MDPATATYAGSAHWNLSRKCRSLSATFGVLDDSDEGATASFQLLGDGVQKYATTQSLASSATTVVDITNVFRLKFAWSVPTPAPGTTGPRTTPVIAGPEMLCSF